jgi:peptidoglycan/LPS O-acetylase OafA/YrhL
MNSIHQPPGTPSGPKPSMPISISDPVLSTQIFIAIFAVALFLSIRKKKDSDLFPLSLTQELKGLAILAVVFSHVGYFLSNDHRFLFPISILAGVGVDLFLFLSGFGLCISALKKNLSIKEFYEKRLLKMFTPFWIVIIILFLLDYFILHISRSPHYIAKSLLGIFTNADLFQDVNSPFWFITPLLFYYLLFPLLFSKKYPWLAAIIIYAVSYIILKFKLPVSWGVMNLYQMHYIAFPLGLAFASLYFQLNNLKRSVFIENIINRLKQPTWFFKMLKISTYNLAMLALLYLICYTAYHSGVGQGPQKAQAISLITMSAILLFFMMKKFEIKALYIFGVCSFEIYLIHWPLMSRFDIFFRFFPGWMAIPLYLLLFILISYGLKKLMNRIDKIKIDKKLIKTYT